MQLSFKTQLLNELAPLTAQDSDKRKDLWKNYLKKSINERHAFDEVEWAYHAVYDVWPPYENPPPAVFAEELKSSQTQAAHWIRQKKLTSFSDLQKWSFKNYEEFWAEAVAALGIIFREPFSRVVDLTHPTRPHWLPNASLNIIESCFLAPSEQPALVEVNEKKERRERNYAELKKQSALVAASLQQLGFKKGDAAAIDLPMNLEAVVIYLGIIYAGGQVVSIADSFAPDEISTRLILGKAKLCFSQDYIFRAGKDLPLYEKVVAAKGPVNIVLRTQAKKPLALRPGDLLWDDFLAKATRPTTEAQAMPAMENINILFSSGTTGDPKAIPWNQTTPLKAAVDAYFHQDIRPGSRVCWPTNLGWMMGPWLIFATLLNRGTLCLFDGAPQSRAFGEFIQNEKVSHLGVVPSLVKSWRESACMEGLDWSALRNFSSTGECSNPSDMLYLMWLGAFKPVLEYCGGTEIGGAYLSQSLLEDASPSTFSTPTVGLGLKILGENFCEASPGELFLQIPSMGLSVELLNKDHDKVYFDQTPIDERGYPLRRHGDEVERVGQNYFRALGRADDTMNLGGIKISSAEIERVLNGLDFVLECAAVAVTPPGGGPSLLKIFCVPKNFEASMQVGSLVGSLAEQKAARLHQMQKAVKDHLNPLFKISDLIFIEKLPRTASNKIMRRLLRA